jgi:hypothetical protein
LNPYQVPKAELFWMTPQERLDARMGLSARRWAVAAALAGIVETAITCRPDRLFLTIHGAMAVCSLVAGGTLAASLASRGIFSSWSRWSASVLLESALLFTAGTLGIAAAAMVLRWLGHPAPWGPLEKLGPQATAGLCAAGFTLALSACGAWAVAWRWKVQRKGWT